MTPAQFFETFELLSNLPNAVGKMRELILDLAVRGGLVHFDVSKIGRVADYVTFLNGYAFKSEWFRPTGVRLCRNINVGHGTLDWQEVAHVDQEVEREFSKFSLSAGDIVLSLDRPIISTGLKVARLRSADLPCLLLQRVAKAIPRHDELDLDFFFLWLNSPAFISAIDPGRSNGVPHLSTKEVLELPFNLPPLAEQKRIVAKVDELMALCDRLEAQQKQREAQQAALVQASLTRFIDAPTPANLEFLFHKSYAVDPAELRKTILTLAVQGKLVPQDPYEENAEALLQRIDSEREKLITTGKIRHHKPLGIISDDRIPYQIPNGWQWRYLGDVCYLITDGAHHTPQYLDTGIPFLSVKDVSSGEIDFSDTRYISEDAHRDLCKRCQPELGDILLTKVGTTGIAVTVDVEQEFSIFVSLALLKFSQINIDRNYLKHLINSPFVRQQSAENTQGIGNKNLVLRLINLFIVPIPPLAEQKRIVAKVEELMGVVDRLEAQLAASREVGAKLIEAVVAEIAAAA